MTQAHYKIDPLDITDLKEAGLVQFMQDCFGPAITASVIHEAIVNREIVPTKIGKNNWFARRDGIEWFEVQRQKSIQAAKNRKKLIIDVRETKSERLQRHKAERARRVLAETTAALAKLEE